MRAPSLVLDGFPLPTCCWEHLGNPSQSHGVGDHRLPAARNRKSVGRPFLWCEATDLVHLPSGDSLRADHFRKYAAQHVNQLMKSYCRHFFVVACDLEPSVFPTLTFSRQILQRRHLLRWIVWFLPMLTCSQLGCRPSCWEQQGIRFSMIIRAYSYEGHLHGNMRGYWWNMDVLISKDISLNKVCVSTCRGIHLSFMNSFVHGVPWIYVYMYSELQNTVAAKYRLTDFLLD
jgi:hypothetical protein